MGLFGISDYTSGGIGNKILGNIVDYVGGKVGIPETGLSEFIAGGPTRNTSNPVYAAESTGYTQPKTTTDPNYGPQEFIGPPQNTGVGTNQPATNTGDGFDMKYYPGWDETAARQDWAATGGSKANQSTGGTNLNNQLRSEIEGGYNTYINDLNNLYGGLGTQAKSQEDIANRSYGQSISDLNANKQSSLMDLGTSQRKVEENQVKNLRDISSNLQNQYMAGNVMLGSRGAGDSSAANQYSYALNRIGSKERGNVMNQTASSLADIETQKAKLNNIVTQETSRLDTELGNTKSQISSWLAEQQNAVGQMIAQGKLNKSQEIASLTQNLLNQAISAYNTKVQEVANKKSTLENWAASNATNIQQLASNMQAIGQFAPNMPTANTLNGGVSMDAQGNMRGLYGFGTSDEDKNNYFR